MEAAAEEVPVAEAPAGAGKAVDLTGKPVFFLCMAPCVGPTMENLSAHLFSVVKR